jgi:hypothetical protein
MLRLIRCCLNDKLNEAVVLDVYKNLLEQKLTQSFETLIGEDQTLLEQVYQNPDHYHWMYSHVLLYRIGQKQILLRHIAFCSLLNEKCT